MNFIGFLKNLFSKNQDRYIILIKNNANYKDNLFVVKGDNITFRDDVDGVRLKNKTLSKVNSEEYFINKNKKNVIYASQELLDSVGFIDERQIVVIAGGKNENNKFVFRRVSEYGKMIQFNLPAKREQEETQNNTDTLNHDEDSHTIETTVGNVADDKHDGENAELRPEGQKQINDGPTSPAAKNDCQCETMERLTEQKVKEMICELLVRVFAGRNEYEADDETLNGRTVEDIEALLARYVQNKVGDYVINEGLRDCVKRSDISEFVRENMGDDRISKQIDVIAREFVSRGEFEKIDEKVKDNIKSINDKICEISESVAKKIDREEYVNQYEKLKQEIDEVKEQYENSDIGQLNKEVEDLKEKVQEKDTEIENNGMRISVLEEKNTQQEGEIGRLTNDFELKAQRLESTEKKLKQTTTDLKIKEKQCNEQAEAISSQQQKIGEQEETIKSKDGKIQNMEQEIGGLKTENGELHGKISVLESANVELKEEQDFNCNETYNKFINGLNIIHKVLESEKLFLPCADNQDDCVEIQKSLLTKISEFSNKANKKIDSKAKPSFIEETITGMIKDELTDKRSWMYEVAKYMIYSRHGFSIDTEREKGIALKKETITKLWNELDAILAVHKFRLITPDLFADTVSEISGVEDVTGMRSTLDNLVPNSSQYLENVSRINKDGVIRDCVEIGYMFKNKIMKTTKIIR